MVMDSMMLGKACVYVPLDPRKISAKEELREADGSAEYADLEPWDRCIAKVSSYRVASSASRFVRTFVLTQNSVRRPNREHKSTATASII